jgi:propanol-preferring alcohol dehydrogenase
MKAIQYTAFGTRPKLVEIDQPAPGPGEILLRITASGLCHSDEFVMSLPEEGYPYPMPMTLGHEPAGVVETLGEGASGVEVGQAVIVYGCWGEACARSVPTAARSCA